MKSTRVLLIESERSDGVSYTASLKRRYQVQIAHSGRQGLTLAADRPPDVVILDAASLRTSGDRICIRLRALLGTTPIIHIRLADGGPTHSPADVLLSPPFTARKLINRIEQFAVPSQANILETGPFSLNLEQQTLVTPWGEKTLTPKLAELMEVFMRNLNQILERKHLMQTVWKTDYMGDTRTLDVHIRWIRQVVEPNPRKPVYITTVRGVGYRFTIPSDVESSVDTAANGDPH